MRPQNDRRKAHVDEMTGRIAHRVRTIALFAAVIASSGAILSQPRARAQSTPAAATKPAATAAIAAPAAVAAVHSPAPPNAAATPNATAPIDKASAQTSTARGHIDGAIAETPGELEYRHTTDASVMDSQNWALMAYKRRHQLILYFKGRMYKTYHAVFGRSPESGTKLWAGDRRTPEGLYVIVRKYKSRRYKRFLRINYPNKLDRHRYEDLRERGVVPIIDGRPRPEGNAIGIHGTDEDILNRGDIDWTTGCISVDNDAIMELDRLVPNGTIILIKP
jgi:lipoprotein-anchoring transpeptidase ErfK/SrfK